METWIALLRGINVGGRNILSMAELRADLEELGLKNVRTYIQSGNVVFNADAKHASDLARTIGRHIEERHEIRPHVLVLGRQVLEKAIEANPFPAAVGDPNTLHFFFLEKAPMDPDLTSLEAAKAPTEHYVLKDRVFYLHAPDGIGRSKLAANTEKYLGVVGTGRNYRTVNKLASMAMRSDP